MIVLVLIVLLAFVGLVGLLGLSLWAALLVVLVLLAAGLVFGPDLLRAVALEQAYRSPSRGQRTNAPAGDEDV